MAGLYEMQYILPDIVKHLDAGVPCMLATVLYAKGPAPRSTGASMLVDPAGSQYGTIGGGLAEYEAIELAERIIRSGESAASDLPSAAVKACGPDANRSGCIHVLLDRIGPEDADLFRVLLEAQENHVPACLFRKIENARVTCRTVRTGEGLPAFPRLQGEWLVQPACDPGTVYVFGGGHVSFHLVPELRRLDFTVRVLEDRSAFAAPERFPDAFRVDCLSSYDRIPDVCRLEKWDAAVVLSAGHGTDFQVLRQVLRTPAGYVGCIGSSKKVSIVREKLLGAGFSETDFARVHTPIGTDILAETPQEMAVSIAGDLIRYRAVRRKSEPDCAIPEQAEK